MSTQLREANGRFATPTHTESAIELPAMESEALGDDGGKGLCDRCHEEVDITDEPLCWSCQDKVCTECGELNDDGEGYDGLCGNCADRADENGDWD
ncbi:hypothetical protein V6N00_13390 [Tersicoccus sp. MR15.9]|uniref:hypothetical protein n=1 Tax=Tersicoccus mangrovi TaxID=3121635 RepID=UPI002FE6A54C